MGMAFARVLGQNYVLFFLLDANSCAVGCDFVHNVINIKPILHRK